MDLVPALPRLLAFVRWMVDNPGRTHLYLRQVSIPGVDTKFIERHKDVLTDWLRIVLDVPPVSSTSFEKEFGFRSKPVLVRFRILDPALAYGPGGLRDLSIPAGDVLAFSRAAFSGSAFRRVFIIENDVTALSLPDMAGSIAMFGRGYGTDFLGDGRWLVGLDVFYWGDIDTHGFAILDQFRQVLPGLQSLFMDESTLLQNRDRWVSEPRPTRRILENLTAEEADLYQGLVDDRWGSAVRLEQELIEFSVIQRSLKF